MCFECLVIVEGVEDGEAILHVFWGAGAGLAPALSPGAGHGGWHRTRLSASGHRKSIIIIRIRICVLCAIQIYPSFADFQKLFNISFNVDNLHP